MTIEVQVRDSVLAQAVTEEVQRHLFTLCVASPVPAVSVDHVDTVDQSARFTTVPGAGVDVRLDVGVHMVTDDDVMAHPNAPAPTHQAIIGVVIRLAVVDRKLVIARALSDASALPGPRPLRAAVQAALDARLASLNGELIDVAPMVTALTPLAPSEADLVHGQGVVALRFGAHGPASPRLGPGQDWGVFLDADEAIGMIERRLPRGLPTRVVWQPQGAAPSLALTLSFDLSFVGEVNGVATAIPQFHPPSLLRLAISWGVNLSGIASVFERLARKLLRNFLRDRIPDAVHDGAQSFYFDVPLPPPPSFLGARAEWAGITASPAGMTLGGPVRAAPDADRGLLDLSVHRFGRPVVWLSCRELARTGDGSPPRTFHRSDPTLRATAGAGFADAGALCTAHIMAPNAKYEAWMSLSTAGASINLPLGLAATVPSEIRILVSTARGCRLIDLGIPDIRVDGDGNVDVQVNRLENCLHLDGPWLKLATGAALTPEDFRPVPLEDEDWMAALNATIGLDSHLLTMRGLHPGEAIRVQGRGLHLEVVADDRGRIAVPALLGRAPTLSDFIIERASGQDLPADTEIVTVTFTWLADLGPADAAAVRDVGGHAVVARLLGEDLVVEEFRPDEDDPVLAVEPGSEVALNPQPLPPHPPEAARIAAAAGVDDAVAVALMPGHPSTLVLARTANAEMLVVDGGGSDTPRRAGVYHGPMVGMDVDGSFAISSNATTVQLFSVQPLEPATISQLVS
ncbi:hypothetical protein GA707_13840 [Nostocoides sp. F2B08]|uniref:hypothetical protein n=1 Tax=Nostocoides sp. F2B08 TaxID=2653936 RepID=UPI001262E89B|nr:hypothetical protein [Tetrasphaera sp. F2B08]KAB7743199.1 hypothetical protein GA707_13840 [Tetrasphaera sp. F2B08]